MLSDGVWGEDLSSSFRYGVTVERASLACFSCGMKEIGGKVLRDNGVGESNCLERRSWVKEEGFEDMTFSRDLGLILADGESSITLSLSSSTLPGDA